MIPGKLRTEIFLMNSHGDFSELFNTSKRTTIVQKANSIVCSGLDELILIYDHDL